MTGKSKSAQKLHSGKHLQEKVEQNVGLIAKLEESARIDRTTSDKIADWITGFCGSMPFVFIHVCIYGVWIFVNTSPRFAESLRADPYPYQLLNLLLAFEAFFLSTFILISQNRQNRVSERRNHLDLQINLLSEQENSKMLLMLEKISARLNLDIDDDAAALSEKTDPMKVLKQIKQVIEKD